MNFLLLDVGSSFIKGALFDTDTINLYNIVKIPSGRFLEPTHPFKRENKIEDFIQDTREIIEELSAGIKLSGIFISSQMHGFVLTDLNGKPMTNFISWQDRRSLEVDSDTGENAIDSVRRLVKTEDMKKGGTPLRSGPSVFTLYHMQKALKGLGELKLFTLGDYIGYCLTRGKTGCSITQAAATGLCNIENGAWNSDVLTALGLENINFIDIVDETTPYGEVIINGVNVPIYPSVGDQQAAILGSFIKEDELAINIGTGAQVCTIVKQLQYGDYEVRPFFEGNYLKTITSLSGGRALNVLFGFIKNILIDIASDLQICDNELWNTLNLLAENAQEVLKFDMAFFKQTRGIISNIAENNFNVASMFKGAYNSMASEYFDSGILLGSNIKKVVCMGGLARKSKPLRDSISERFGVCVEIPRLTEDALWGLASLSLLASRICGNYGSAQEACSRFGKETTK